MYTIVLAVLLSVVVTVRGAEREFLFPIVTHVGGHSSTMFVLNPTEYKVRYGLTGHSPYSGHSGLSSTLEPNSIESFRPDFDLNPSDFRGGWGILKYQFLGVPAADKERVESLRLLAWTELERYNTLPEHPDRELVSVTNISAVEAALEFKVPGILRRKQEAGNPAEVAIAILNPSEEPIQIEVTLFYHGEVSSSGPDAWVKNTLSVPPMKRLSRFLWELMIEGKDDLPERPPRAYQSSLCIQGSAPIAVAALLYYPNGVFGNLPVVRVAQR